MVGVPYYTCKSCFHSIRHPFTLFFVAAANLLRLLRSASHANLWFRPHFVLFGIFAFVLITCMAVNTYLNQRHRQNDLWIVFALESSWMIGVSNSHSDSHSDSHSQSNNNTDVSDPSLLQSTTKIVYPQVDGIDMGVLSEKPVSFFRSLQHHIDQSNDTERCQRYGYTLLPEQEQEQQPCSQRRIFFGALMADET